MASDFDFSDTNPLLGRAEELLLEIESQLEPNWGNAPPQEQWLNGFVYEKSGGKPLWKPSYAVNHVEGRSDRGTIEFEKGGYVFGPSVRMKRKTYGREASIDDLALIDFEGWAGAPAEIQHAIDTERARVFARMLNYGHLITCWTGVTFLNAAHPANPRKSKLGTFSNILPNQSAVPRRDRIKAQIKMLRKVRGLDGEFLGLGERPLYVWSPTEYIEEDTDSLGKLVLVPDTDGVTGGGGNTSKVYGRAIPVEVRGMRSDMLVVSAQPPSEKLKSFIYRRGVGTGAPSPNTDPNNAGGGLPEFETFMWNTDSEKYKNEGMLGFAQRHRRGFALRSPHCINASFGGAATATVDGISYAALPAKGFY